MTSLHHPGSPWPTSKRTSSLTDDFGGSLGGPILKDRLWFFAAYNPSFRRQVVEAPGITLPDQTLTQHLFATKLTWSAGPRTDFTFTLHGDPSTRRELDVGSVPGSVLNPEAITDKGRAGGIVFSTLVRHQLAGHRLLQLDVSRFAYTNNTDPPPRRVSRRTSRIPKRARFPAAAGFSSTPKPSVARFAAVSRWPGGRTM